MATGADTAAMSAAAIVPVATRPSHLCAAPFIPSSEPRAFVPEPLIKSAADVDEATGNGQLCNDVDVRRPLKVKKDVPRGGRTFSAASMMRARLADR
jgi:hypothetical protein